MSNGNRAGLPAGPLIIKLAIRVKPAGSPDLSDILTIGKK